MGFYVLALFKVFKPGKTWPVHTYCGVDWLIAFGFYVLAASKAIKTGNNFSQCTFVVAYRLFDLFGVLYPSSIFIASRQTMICTLDTLIAISIDLGLYIPTSSKVVSRKVAICLVLTECDIDSLFNFRDLCPKSILGCVKKDNKLCLCTLIEIA